jgi:hypothetical protein
MKLGDTAETASKPQRQRGLAMRRTTLRCWGLGSIALSAMNLGACLGEAAPGGVGQPCVTADEDVANFSGFSLGEVTVETGGGACGPSLVCLVHDFQGRASCPSGQANPEAPQCKTPSGESVKVPVDPQLSMHPAARNVVCSCRCDGPDPGAEYCACPSDMRCEPLIDGVAGDENKEFAGSYCVY